MVVDEMRLRRAGDLMVVNGIGGCPVEGRAGGSEVVRLRSERELLGRGQLHGGHLMKASRGAGMIQSRNLPIYTLNTRTLLPSIIGIIDIVSRRRYENPISCGSVGSINGVGDRLGLLNPSVTSVRTQRGVGQHGERRTRKTITFDRVSMAYGV